MPRWICESSRGEVLVEKKNFTNRTACCPPYCSYFAVFLLCYCCYIIRSYRCIIPTGSRTSFIPMLEQDRKRYIPRLTQSRLTSIPESTTIVDWNWRSPGQSAMQHSFGDMEPPTLTQSHEIKYAVAADPPHSNEIKYEVAADPPHSNEIKCVTPPTQPHSYMAEDLEKTFMVSPCELSAGTCGEGTNRPNRIPRYCTLVELRWSAHSTGTAHSRSRIIGGLESPGAAHNRFTHPLRRIGVAR